jgi:hypothetical protein
MSEVTTRSVNRTVIKLTFLNGNAQTCCSGGVPLAGNLGLPTGEKSTRFDGAFFILAWRCTINESLSWRVSKWLRTR